MLKLQSTIQNNDKSKIIAERNTLLNKITRIDSNNLSQVNTTVAETLLFGNSKYYNEVNLQILNASINFIPTSKIFDEFLLNS